MSGRIRVGQWVRLGVVAVGISLGAPAASANSAGASEAPAAAPAPRARYQAPPPTRIYRFHVFSTMKDRWKKKATIDAHVLTTKGGVLEGDHGLLERELETAAGTADSVAGWVPFANVTVKKLLPKGRLEIEIESEQAEARVKRKGKLPFSPGQKVLLQIDRVMNP